MSFLLREVPGPATSTEPTVEWEETPCLLCGGARWTPLVEAPDQGPGGSGLWFVVVQCHECGLCLTNPRPTAASIARFYPDIYPPHRAPNVDAEKRRRFRVATHFARRPRKHRRTLAWHGAGRLLDFGCGGGSFLYRMHLQGWNVTGLDTSPVPVRNIQDDLGLRALVGTLPHAELKAGSFDVITMWHSLEHVHDPVAVLHEARRLLVPGGRLLVAVPNIDSLPFRWFGHAWFGLDLPRHLTHFAPWTLHLMLQKTGFRVGPVQMVRHSDWLRSSARLACQTAPRDVWRRCLTFKPVSRLATWYGTLLRQNDCIMVTAER
jgi:2-polyprenyl-3-methyl-5-hydroxy-6-metoxy-1,4-benzoquinol methylase